MSTLVHVEDLRTTCGYYADATFCHHVCLHRSNSERGEEDSCDARGCPLGSIPTQQEMEASDLAGQYQYEDSGDGTMIVRDDCPWIALETDADEKEAD